MRYKYYIEFEEAHHPQDDTKLLVYLNLKAKHGISKAALIEAIDRATEKFVDYNIFPDPHGLLIEGTLK